MDVSVKLYWGHEGPKLTRYRGSCAIFRARTRGSHQGYMALLYTQRGETLIRKSIVGPKPMKPREAKWGTTEVVDSRVTPAGYTLGT